MSSPEQYTPRTPTALDVVKDAKRTADAILRSNPLTNAVVSEGLLRFVGNHVDVNGDKINFLWIGEFTPPDTTLGKPQRGIVMWRDDSAGAAVNDGVLAFALYDHDPGGDSLGLRQTMHFNSVDNKALMLEARHGGFSFPRTNITMYEGSGTNRNRWPSITSTSFVTVFEGFVSCVGNNVYARYWVGTPAGTTAEFRVTASWGSGSATGATHSQGSATFGLEEYTLDVTGARGDAAMQVKVEGRVASGAGPVDFAPVSFVNYTVAG